MKRPSRNIFIGLSVVAGALLWAAASRRSPTLATANPVKSATAKQTGAIAAVMHTYQANIDNVNSALNSLATTCSNHDLERARRAFLKARLAYKRVEWLAEHYTPLTAAALNGPALDHPDEENPKVVIKPTGLQVVEQMLYASMVDTVAMDSAAIQSRIALVNVRRLSERAAETAITESQLFDAARLELARMISLGISGWDTPLTNSALPEAAVVVESVSDAILQFAPNSETSDSLKKAATKAIEYLNTFESPASFNHYEFITRHANAVARQIGVVQQAAGIPRLSDHRPWSASAETLFDSGSFDPQAFAPPGARQQHPALIALGQRLFHETRLSGANDRSCASCHVPSMAFADGRRVPVLLTEVASKVHNTISRNTPSLLNAALQTNAFADARLAFLEDQISAVVNNEREMGGDLQSTSAILAADVSYRPALIAAFGEVPDSAAISRELKSALAAYLRSLTRLNSRFDRAMRGDSNALAMNEREGFNTFMGKGRCGSCHFIPLFNGTIPPSYSESDLEVLGVPASMKRSTSLDADRGAGAVDRAPMHEHAFKTPTLRNASVTSPYMHNGAFKTLAQVIDFYDAGGGSGTGVRVSNQTLSADSLYLTAKEKRNLIVFIGALTDTSATRPPR